MSGQAQPGKSHRLRNTVVIVGVAVLVLILASLASTPRNDVVITSDVTNIRIDVSACDPSNLCQTKTIEAVKTNSSVLTFSQGDTFIDHTKLPFSVLQNLTNICTSFSLTITQDSLETPGFTVESQDPSMPIVFQNIGTNITITNVVRAPDHAYTGGLEWLLSGTLACTFAVSSTSVNVTGENLAIDYTGTTSSYFGPASQAIGNPITVFGGTQFTVTLTLQNGDYYQTHSINFISLTTPGFILVSISPSLPYTLSPSSSVKITLTIQAPNSNYNGPLGILLSTA